MPGRETRGNEGDANALETYCIGNNLVVATLMNSVIGAVPAFAIAAIVLLFIWMTGGVGR